MNTRVLTSFGVVLGTAAIDCAALLPGWWWITPLLAFLASLLRRGAPVFWLATLGALLGWVAMLLWHGGGNTGRIADVVGDIAFGTTGRGALVIAATMLLAGLLAMSGGWLGGALRRSLRPHRPTTRARERRSITTGAASPPCPGRIFSHRV
ncbi:MAG TPA: hypothetical protein VHV49_14390 [Pseudonocardiaceae bacterium]|nr:hypothetical protein [Pseudonocardiaceae bacterium]